MKFCWFLKVWCSLWLEDRGPLPAWLTRHVGRCPECRAFVRRQREVVERLRADFPANVVKPSSPGLPWIPAEASREPRWRVFGIGGGWPRWQTVGFAVLVVAMGWMVWHGSLRPSRNVRPANLTATVVQTTEEIFQEMPISRGKSLSEWKESFDMPLDTEMRNAMGDMQAALDSLAQSFLPEKLRQSILVASND